jgi:hypothetical protein
MYFAFPVTVCLEKLETLKLRRPEKSGVKQGSRRRSATAHHHKPAAALAPLATANNTATSASVFVHLYQKIFYLEYTPRALIRTPAISSRQSVEHLCLGCANSFLREFVREFVRV